MLDALIARPGGAIEVEECAIELFGERRSGASQRRALIVDIGVLEEGNVNNVRIVDRRGHCFEDVGCLGLPSEFGEAFGLDLHQAASELLVGCLRQYCERIVDDDKADVRLS